MSEKKNMHRLTIPKKILAKGMRLIYIMYVNLGKTGFVERSRKFCTLTLYLVYTVVPYFTVYSNGENNKRYLLLD